MLKGALAAKGEERRDVGEGELGCERCRLLRRRRRRRRASTAGRAFSHGKQRIERGANRRVDATAAHEHILVVVGRVGREERDEAKEERGHEGGDAHDEPLVLLDRRVRTDDEVHHAHNLRLQTAAGDEQVEEPPEPQGSRGMAAVALLGEDKAGAQRPHQALAREARREQSARRAERCSHGLRICRI